MTRNSGTLRYTPELLQSGSLSVSAHLSEENQTCADEKIESTDPRSYYIRIEKERIACDSELTSRISTIPSARPSTVPLPETACARHDSLCRALRRAHFRSARRSGRFISTTGGSGGITNRDLKL